MVKRPYKKAQEEFQDINRKHRSWWSSITETASWAFGGGQEPNPTQPDVIEGNIGITRDTIEEAGMTTQQYNDLIRRVENYRNRRVSMNTIRANKMTPLFKTMKYKNKKYGRKRFKRRRFKTKKQRRRRFRARSAKKYSRMADRIEPYLGETKFTSFVNKTVTIDTINAATVATIIFDVSDWPVQGEQVTQRIGDELMIKSHVLQMSVLSTSTAADLLPLRVVIFKSNQLAGSIRPTTIFEAGTPNENWLTARFKPGFGKLVMDFVIQPKISPENEWNTSSDMYVPLSRTIKVNKKMRISPNTTSEFNLAFIYMYVFRGGAKIGTGSVMALKVKTYYKDA